MIAGSTRTYTTYKTYELLQKVSSLLAAAGVERPAFEAQLLLALATGHSRTDILCGMEREVTAEQERRFHELTEQRSRRVPLAYLRGTQEFYGLEFEVSPAVLVPRPETEMLVDLAIEHLTGRGAGTVIDVGTGSGCIAIAVATSVPGVKVLATDLSAAAIRIARGNAARHNVCDRVRFMRGDALSAIANASADMIVSNPPYIPAEEIEALQPEVRDYEPRTALVTDDGGLAVHRRIASEAARVLRSGGWLAVEVGCAQSWAVESLHRANGLEDVSSRLDLAGIQRVVMSRKPA